MTSEKKKEEELKAADPMNSPKLEPVLLDKVYSYLKERKKASPPQIARDLNLKVSMVMEILKELKRRDKVTIIHE